MDEKEGRRSVGQPRTDGPEEATRRHLTSDSWPPGLRGSEVLHVVRAAGLRALLAALAARARRPPPQGQVEPSRTRAAPDSPPGGNRVTSPEAGV